jgi:hypothetical protein
LPFPGLSSLIIGPFADPGPRAVING